MRGGRRLGISMDGKLQELIYEVCNGFPSRDVKISQIFDQRRFVRMVHYAWKNNLSFNTEDFKETLKVVDKFKNLSEENLETKAIELCDQAEFAKLMFYTAFELENLSI